LAEEGPAQMPWQMVSYSTNKGSDVWDMSWQNHDKNTADPLNKARPDMVTAITQWHSPVSLHGD